MATQEQIRQEAMSGTSFAQLSPEAQHYRAYGTFPTTTQTQQQTQLSQVAPAYVYDTRDFGAGSSAQLVGGEAIKTPDYQPLEAGRQTMLQQLEAGTLAKEEVSKPTELGSFDKLSEQGVDTGRPSPQTVQAGEGLPGGPGAGQVVGAGGQAAGSLSGAQLPSRYQSAFEALRGAFGGTGGLPAGVSGQDLVQSYAPNKVNNLASAFVQTDPFIEGLVAAWQDYINPANQRKSLTDTYNQMLKDSGIQAIDMQLVDMKKIIEGTEDDIRTEVTKSGGFATESQVVALSNARNRQLIKNYNTLLDTRNAKEKYLQTAIQLEQADRQAADARFESAFNMGLQIADYRQKMQQNAIATIGRVQQAIGWGGIMEATQGDPYLASLIERTYGLPQGGLAIAARQEFEAAQRAEQERLLGLQEKQLGIQLKQSQLKTEALHRAKLSQSLAPQPTPSPLESITPYQHEQSIRVIQSVNSLKQRVSNQTVGGLSVVFRNIPFVNNAAKNFEADVEQLKSQIFTRELAAMRDASKTGGAVGNVSDAEGERLSSLLGSLRLNQSPANFTRNLNEIQLSINRWYSALAGANVVLTPDGKLIQITN